MFFIHTVFFLSLSHIIQLKEIDLTKARMLIIRLFIRFIFLFKTAPTNETITNQNEDDEEEEEATEDKVEEEQNVEEEVEEEEEEGAGEEEGNFNFLTFFIVK